MSKPFNIVAALAGAPVMTRAGVQVIELHLMSKAAEGQMGVVVVYADGAVQRYRNDGKWMRTAEDHPRDLVMAPVIVYVNVWAKPNNTGCPWVGGTSATREEAEKSAARYLRDNPTHLHLGVLERPI